MIRSFQCAVAILLLASSSAYACSSCGCTLSSDWDSQGFATRSGWHFDLRYDFIDQSQLRSGTGTVDRSGYPFPQDREVELRTINRYTTFGLDDAPDPNWGFNLQLPYIDRSHTTMAEGDLQRSASHSTGIGDARLLVRYQGFTDEHNIGLQFGLKLPTGAHDVRFASGPQAGAPLDRGLQPGTGTTDLLLGAYTFRTLNQNWDWFGQGLFQSPLQARDQYRAGTSLNVNTGLRYMATPRVTPELQLNLRVQRRDSGAQADVANSGGTLLDLSPGLSIDVGHRMHAYGFLQVPLFQRVNGFQLAPHWTASVGLHASF